MCLFSILQIHVEISGSLLCNFSASQLVYLIKTSSSSHPPKSCNQLLNISRSLLAQRGNLAHYSVCGLRMSFTSCPYHFLLYPPITGNVFYLLKLLSFPKVIFRYTHLFSASKFYLSLSRYIQNTICDSSSSNATVIVDMRLLSSQ